MSQAELKAIQETSYLRGGLSGETYFTKDLFKSAAKAQSRLSLGSSPFRKVKDIESGKFNILIDAFNAYMKWKR